MVRMARISIRTAVALTMGVEASSRVVGMAAPMAMELMQGEAVRAREEGVADKVLVVARVSADTEVVKETQVLMLLGEILCMARLVVQLA
jgi:hypothetical protein